MLIITSQFRGVSVRQALPVFCVECSAFLGYHCYGKPSGAVIDSEVIYEFCSDNRCETKRKMRANDTTAELDLPLEQAKHLS